jgi:phospholipid/cholesterol/gamma-HCH transport system ATP-binding protein
MDHVKSNPTEETPILEIKGLVKKFGQHTVLNNISMSFDRGKTTAIIGPSGCGKTVLVKHLICLLRPSIGEVLFKGQRIDRLSEQALAPIRTQIGFLFQAGALFDSLTVRENILFPVSQHTPHVNGKEADDLVRSKLTMVGLDGYQDHYPSSLSGGQQKRVALARAIALDPEVILYDEPTTGLDPIRSDVINELILKLQRELNVTSVVVTHDMKSAYKVGDRIVMLHDGNVIVDGDADHVQNHTHPIVQQFIHGRLSEQDLASLNAS